MDPNPKDKVRSEGRRTYFNMREESHPVAIDLSTITSLPIKLDLRTPRLWFSKGLVSSEPAFRTITEIREVLLDQEAEGPEKLYAMYTDVRLPDHEDLLRSHNLRYDLTVMRSGFLGTEFMKTLGHYHPVLPGQGISYPEIYEVLHGGALYLLQRIRSLMDPRRVSDVVEIEARPGDRVVIPPNYGHVTVNPYKTTLVVADVTARGFQPIYTPFKSLRGAAYHLVLERGKPNWIPNPRYLSLPGIRRVGVRGLENLGIRRSKALYRALVENPQAFEFLTKPIHHMDLLGELLH